MKPPAFQFYADDFLAGVAEMTGAEVGAYILLLSHQWNRGSIPVEPERQQMIGKGGVTPHVISKFNLCEDGCLRNARMEVERAKQDEFREIQKTKGLASGRARALKKQQELNRGSTVVEPEPEPEGQPKGNSPSPSPLYPIVPKGTVTNETQLRAGRIFGRRPTTLWDHAETKAYAKNRHAIEATSEPDWLALESFYAAPQAQTFARTSLATLLNQWNGEVDRARDWKNKQAPTRAEPRLKIS